MISLKGKNVFVTGASSGIGKATAELFASEGANLIICARRIDRIEKFAEELNSKYGVPVYFDKLDVRNRVEVEKFIDNIPAEFRTIEILVNNAGLALGYAEFQDDKVESWETMLDTNVKGLLYVTKKVVSIMIENRKGHIINLGSIAGHEAYPKGSVYCASKHAVAAITRSLRMDLIDKNIRVSSVDPGMVETEFSNVRFYGNNEKADNVYKGINPLKPQDIAEAILFCATRPPHANINEMIIMPSVQANAFVTYRKN